MPELFFKKQNCFRSDLWSRSTFGGRVSVGKRIPGSRALLLHAWPRVLKTKPHWVGEAEGLVLSILREISPLWGWGLGAETLRRVWGLCLLDLPVPPGTDQPHGRQVPIPMKAWSCWAAGRRGSLPLNCPQHTRGPAYVVPMAKKKRKVEAVKKKLQSQGHSYNQGVKETKQRIFRQESSIGG